MYSMTLVFVRAYVDTLPVAVLTVYVLPRYLLVRDKSCFVQRQISMSVCCSLRLAPAMIIITLVMNIVNRCLLPHSFSPRLCFPLQFQSSDGLMGGGGVTVSIVAHNLEITLYGTCWHCTFPWKWMASSWWTELSVCERSYVRWKHGWSPGMSTQQRQYRRRRHGWSPGMSTQ